MLIIKSYNDEIMSCELQVTANRPVFGSSYTTPLFNFRDEKVNFLYKEFDQIDLNTSTYDNNIAAILAYYAYNAVGGSLAFAQYRISYEIDLLNLVEQPAE